MDNVFAIVIVRCNDINKYVKYNILGQKRIQIGKRKHRGHIRD